MGIRDILLGKENGAKLKSLKKEQALNHEAIKLMNEISAFDLKADFYRKNDNITGLFECINKQMELLEEIQTYALVKTQKLQYDFKDIEKKLSTFEKHLKKELKKVDYLELKLTRNLRKGRISKNSDKIRLHINQTRTRLNDFESRLKKMRRISKEFKRSIQHRCKKKIIKIKKIYRFT